MHSQTKPTHLFLVLALLLILCGAGGQKPLCAQTTISQVTSVALRDTNGQKIIKTPSGLHAVFVSGSDVKYLTSTDGITWSAPVALRTVATGASRPAIAVAGNTIGVAYVQGIDIYYRYKLSNGNWSPAVQIGAGPDVAMVGYGSTMHLTFGGFEVLYLSFPATSPSGNGWQIVSGSPLCGNTDIYMPAIAVMPMSASNSTARVRIAFFRRWTPDFTCPNSPTQFGLELYEKQGTNGFASLISGFGQTTGYPYGISTSLAANISTGEFYLAASYVDNGSATFIKYQDVWNNGPWRNAQILPTRGLIDIAAASCGKFRIAVSDIVSGNGTYGPTWYRTGQWSGVNPTWAEPQKVQVTALGRDPQAFFWTPSREVHVMFEESSGTSYFVKHSLVTRRTPPLNDCRIKDVREETRDAVTQVRE
jgi:hypothetical protein